jgi:hypothetical protein
LLEVVVQEELISSPFTTILTFLTTASPFAVAVPAKLSWNGFKIIACPPTEISHSQNNTSSVSAEASTVPNFLLVNVIFPPLIVYSFPTKASETVTLAHVFFSTALKSVLANDNLIVLFNSSNPLTKTKFTAKIALSLVAISTPSKLTFNSFLLLISHSRFSTFSSLTVTSTFSTPSLISTPHSFFRVNQLTVIGVESALALNL